MALADYQALVDSMVRDESNTIDAPDRDLAISLAVQRYSQDAERRLVKDVAWTPSGYFGPLPEGWVPGCYLVDGEYPINQNPRSVLEISVYQTPDGQLLAVPAAIHTGELVRVTFAAPHVLEGAGPDVVDTIPLVHREAVASYAAHVLCKQLATKYSGERESSIGADRSDTESRARNYAARARDYRASYFAGIGKVDPQADKGGGAAATLGQEPAAAIGTLPGRGRSNLTYGAVL